MTALNAKLAYAVLDQIDAHPETWDQSIWDCGTKACFAGWVIRLSGGAIDDPGRRRELPMVVSGPAEIIGMDVDLAAYRLLGITEFTSEEDLFDGFQTRIDLGRIVEHIFGPRPAALR